MAGIIVQDQKLDRRLEMTSRRCHLPMLISQPSFSIFRILFTYPIFDHPQIQSKDPNYLKFDLIKFLVMKRFFVFFVCLFLIHSFILGQEVKFPTPIIEGIPFIDVSIDETTPAWAKMLYQENPNIFEVENAFVKWRRENPLKKNDHTRNFKHLMNFLNEKDAINSEGFIQLPSADVVRAKNHEWMKQRATWLAPSQSINNRNGNNWQAIGPFQVKNENGDINVQANIYSITQCPGNLDVLYAGSENKAVFKTSNRGDSWFCVSDDYIFSGPMELEVHPIDPDTVYLGAQSDIYMTTNGGQTWTSVYTESNIHASSIIINPSNPDHVLAGTEKGILRSMNGGESWSKETTERAYDLKFQPGNATIAYAIVNNPVSLQCDFYRSTDGGNNWTQITNGWPNEPSTGNKCGRMTVSTGDPMLIYAFIGAKWTAAPTEKRGVKIMKSTNGGLSWTTVYNYDTPASNPIDSGQGYFDWDIEVSDTNSDIVFLGTQSKWVTLDGFSTTNFITSNLGHADVQEVLFNGNELWVTNDGGIIKFNDLTFSSYEVKSLSINATNFWSFDQGWNRDAQVGSHYHNGTSARTDSYGTGIFRGFGGAEPQFSALKHPYPDKIWSKGYGEVNGRTLPDIPTDPTSNFNYNLRPNSEYGSATWRESEIEVLPYRYDTHFAGMDNYLMRSDDFGLGWDTVATFGNVNSRVTKIEIPKSNPDVMYIAEYNSSGFSLHKSIDGGNSFTTIPNPPVSGTRDGVYISVNDANPSILFFATRNGGTDQNRIFKTIDGGMSWINITTPTLNNHDVRDILAVSATDGGIYLACSNAVFYRNNLMADWMPCITGLPADLGLRDIKPFYKEGKVRIAGTDRGVYGSVLIDQPNTVIPQPSVNTTEGTCDRDTFYFEDFSVLNHTGASWSWSFDPMPAYVSDPNIRNPKVVFGVDGSFSATMTISQDGNTFSKTLDKEIVIDSKCYPDSFAGHAYAVSEYGQHATITNIDKSLNAFTMMAWIRPEETQVSTAFMFSKSDANVGINFSGTTKDVRVHYPVGSVWAVNTGLEAPANEWSHVAITSDAATGEIILYVNGESFEFTSYTAIPIDFDIIKIGWQHNWWGGRWFNGKVDEFCLYEKALSQDEVRLQMHLVKDPSTDPSLVHYYQFNEPDGSTTIDKAGILRAETPGNREISGAPVGLGTSSKQTISSPGVKDFPNEGLMVEFPGSGPFPNGEIVVTRLSNQPDVNPKDILPASQNYWLVNNYGDNQNFSPLVQMSFLGYGNIDALEASDPGLFQLYKRRTGNDLYTWGNELSGATSAIADPVNLITFMSPGVSSFSQFTISKDGCVQQGLVQNTENDGSLSLRELVSKSCFADTIRFDPTLAGSTVSLTTGEIPINRNMAILGLGSGQITLDANSLSRVFKIAPNITVTLSGMKIKNGASLTNGGGLLNQGTLYLKDIIFESGTENGTPKGFTNLGNIWIVENTVKVIE